MEQFRRGDELEVTLTVRNEVGIKDVFIILVHEKDDSTHILWGVQGQYGNDNPLPPNEETRLSWGPTIAEDQKLGVYVLDKVNFKTFDESTLDAPFPPGALKFEVVSDLGADQTNIEEDLVDMEEVAAPIVIKELSIQLAR